MKIAYEAWNPGDDALGVIDQADQIARSYAAQGYDLTLRQLYYQFVSRDLIPNTQQSYKRLGSIVNKGRMAGLLDWDHIVDRTRNLEALAHWQDAAEIVRACANQFRLNRWENQPERCEVWVEKEALAKMTDSRVGSYLAAYGRQSWELDALEPQVLDALITAAILECRDDDLWEADEERETAGRDRLTNPAQLLAIEEAS